MSSTGRHLLEKREGSGLKAYKDSVGVWTIGYGHTHFDGPPIPKAGMNITPEEQDEMLSRDLGRYEDIVNKNVKVSLKQNEFDALVSICYNVEAALGPKSGIVKHLNAGDKSGAAQAILAWNKPPEIQGRRRTEYKQFLTPYTHAPSVGGAIVAAGGSGVASYYHWGIQHWIEITASAAFLGALAYLLIHTLRKK